MKLKHQLLNLDNQVTRFQIVILRFTPDLHIAEIPCGARRPAKADAEGGSTREGVKRLTGASRGLSERPRIWPPQGVYELSWWTKPGLPGLR